jgi:hypothetical protein
MSDLEGVADIVLRDEPGRCVPCECCDGEGAVDDQVCRACDGWGWREP